MTKEEFRALHGYVYLIKCGDFYKIGHTKNLRRRRKQLATGSPLPVRYVHLIWTWHYRNVEKALHYQFNEKRTRGEWFALSDEDVEYIKSLDNYGKPREFPKPEPSSSDIHEVVREMTEELALHWS